MSNFNKNQIYHNNNNNNYSNNNYNNIKIKIIIGLITMQIKVWGKVKWKILLLFQKVPIIHKISIILNKIN
jgi:hypothetical protein